MSFPAVSHPWRFHWLKSGLLLWHLLRKFTSLLCFLGQSAISDLSAASAGSRREPEEWQEGPQQEGKDGVRGRACAAYCTSSNEKQEWVLNLRRSS